MEHEKEIESENEMEREKEIVRESEWWSERVRDGLKVEMRAITIENIGKKETYQARAQNCDTKHNRTEEPLECVSWTSV